MMKLSLSLTLFLAMAGGALAQSLPAEAPGINEPGIEGRRVAETIFASMDQPGRGYVTMGEIEWFRDSAFAGMDQDGDGQVIYAEFAAWDPGFMHVAEDLGRGEAYVTASKIVFAFWDRNGDGVLKTQEFRTSMSHDFRRADLDDDARLTLDEFISGFPIIVAMRAAIRPDL